MGIRVLIKGLDKVIEFPTNTKLPDIEKSIKVNWNEVESLSGLPMDTASRMERAQHLGFDVDKTVFHGTTADFPEFIAGGKDGTTAGELYGKGIYTSRNPDVADSFISGEGSNIINLKTSGKFFDKNTKISPEDSIKINDFISTSSPELMPRFINDFGVNKVTSVFDQSTKKQGLQLFKDAQKSASDLGLPDRYRPTTSRGEKGEIIVEYIDPKNMVDFGSKETKDFINSAISSGKSSEILDNLGYAGLDYSNTERLVFDPKNIRSPNAEFNPAKGSSSNLLASSPVAATATSGALGLLGLGGLLQPQSAEARAKANEQPYKEGEPLFTSDQAKGALDVLATVGSGLVGMSVGGLAGIGTGDPGAIDPVAKGFTRQPSTDAGKEIIQKLMPILGSVDAINQFLSKTAGDAANKAGSNVSPEVGAAAGAGVKALVELFSPI